MFEKRVIIGKKYCVTAPSTCLITANVNGAVVTLVDESTAGQYYFYAPTTSINSSVDPSYILEVAKSGGASTTVRSGSSCNCAPYELTAEAIQQVVPMAWDETSVKFGFKGSVGVNGVSIGESCSAGVSAVSLGRKASASQDAVSIGIVSNAQERYTISIGSNVNAIKKTSIAVGAAFTDTSGSHTCTTQGTGSITIGAGANTLNPTDADGNPVLDDKGNPIESSNSVTIGCKASNSGADSVVIGAQATSNIHGGNVIIGTKAGNNGASEGNLASNCVVIGQRAISTYSQTVSVGSQSKSGLNSVALGFFANALPNNTITIGANASITNTGNTKSENSTVIGYGASASSPNAVVLGAGASTAGEESVVIGANANTSTSGTVIGAGAKALDVQATILGRNATATTNASAIGYRASASFHSIAVGFYSQAKTVGSVAIGNSAIAEKHALSIGSSAQSTSSNAIAIGTDAKSADYGATVIRSTAEDGTYTQLYFSGANTPLANTYENGEAMMGYVVRDKSGNVMTDAEGNAMVGTQKLSVLFPNNRGENAFTPAMLGLDDEWTPKPMFHPSDLDLPIEEPSEPEDVEISIPEPEPEEYTPLPVYPIIEPELDKIEEV